VSLFPVKDNNLRTLYHNKNIINSFLYSILHIASRLSFTMTSLLLEVLLLGISF